MVVFDATMLSILFSDHASTPLDPETRQPVDRVKDRVRLLIDSLDSRTEKILVPTPALSEFLALADSSAPEFLSEINKSSVFKIASFGLRAAVEAAVAYRTDLKRSGDKRAGSRSPWQKVKVDRQVVAIALVEGAHTIFSDDGDLKKLTAHSSIQVRGVADLPLPPEGLQESLF